MYQVYKMENFETLKDVANKLGVDEEFLNNLNTEIGQYIVIPAQSNFKKYIVKSGDSIYSISNKINIDPSSLLRLNGLNESDYIYPNQELLIPSDNINFYVTKESDTLNEISEAIGVDVEKIIETNPKLYLLEDQVVIYNK